MYWIMWLLWSAGSLLVNNGDNIYDIALNYNTITHSLLVGFGLMITSMLFTEFSKSLDKVIRKEVKNIVGSYKKDKFLTILFLVTISSMIYFLAFPFTSNGFLWGFSPLIIMIVAGIIALPYIKFIKKGKFKTS